jgi:hypothetical protein
MQLIVRRAASPPAYPILAAANMTPEEITAIFATMATTFPPFTGQPTNDDLTALRNVMYPLLLDIPFDMDGAHNLIGLIEPTASYTATWGTPFPIPPRPPAYPAIADDASAVIRTRREAKHPRLRLIQRSRASGGQIHPQCYG